MVKAMKKLIVILMVIALCACLFGCASETQVSVEQGSNASMFVEVEKITDSWRVVYHKDTKVMYVVSLGAYNRGTFTVMLNPDGTPMIWEGK